MKLKAPPWFVWYRASGRTTPDAQPEVVPVRVTLRVHTTSVLLSCWRLASRGFSVMGPNVSLALWKMGLMLASLDMLKGGAERVAHVPFNVT